MLPESHLALFHLVNLDDICCSLLEVFGEIVAIVEPSHVAIFINPVLHFVHKFLFLFRRGIFFADVLLLVLGLENIRVVKLPLVVDGSRQTKNWMLSPVKVTLLSSSITVGSRIGAVCNFDPCVTFPVDESRL